MLARWWLYTLPPLDGRLRFVVYALLFVLSWTHVAGILAGPELVFSAPAYAYTPRGLAGLVLGGRPAPTWVMPLRALTALTWVAAAIGLLASSPCPWALPIRFAHHIRVRVVTEGESHKLGLDVPPSQWKHLVSDVAMRQLSLGVDGSHGRYTQPASGPVDAFLRTLVPELRAQLPPGTHGQVVFGYKVRGGFYTLGRVPL